MNSGTRPRRTRPSARVITRSGLQKALKVAVAGARKTSAPFGVILFSIDRFKLINSRFGHQRGDHVLEAVAAHAAATLGDRGEIGRWAGDEFLCLVPDADAYTALLIAEELRHAIETLIVPIDSSLVNTTASFGVACFPDDRDDPERLLIAADEALFEAKRTGRNRVASAANVRSELFRMGALLEVALREERVLPAYQPLVDLKSGTVVGAEALARVVTTEGESIPADAFIEVACQFHLIHKIDRTILRDAFARCVARDDGMTYFVNISGDLLRHPELLKEMLDWTRLRCLDEQGRPRPNRLVIEMTERELFANIDTTRRALEPFLDFGVRLALDDFGSGYSSFQYLVDLPVSFLKIDGNLIRRIQEPKPRAIVRAIQSIASELKIITLAEYVETEKQVEILRGLGVNWAQGHYYGPAALNEREADTRRELSVNWAQGYYYKKA